MVGVLGDYLFIIIDMSNGCLNDVVFVVDQDIILLMVEAGVNFMLDCISLVDFFSGVGLLQGVIYMFVWLSGDGNIVNGVNIFMLGINLLGIYVLLVINNENGCIVID